ncbi:MAG: hypothetical protein ACI8ZX_000676, partial [Planctomycetota bacterium]
MNKLKYITFLLLATCSVAFSQGTNEGDG